MKKFSEFFFSKNFENLFVRNGTELSVGINIRPSILDLEEEIAHHVKYQTCHFFRNSKFSIFFYHFFSNFHEQSHFHVQTQGQIFVNRCWAKADVFMSPFGLSIISDNPIFEYFVILDSDFSTLMGRPLTEWPLRFRTASVAQDSSSMWTNL